MNKVTQQTIAGYKVDEFGVLRGAPCGCYQCSAEGWQRGHPYCDEPTPELLKLEDEGVISRHLDGSWYWMLTTPLTARATTAHRCCGRQATA